MKHVAAVALIHDGKILMGRRRDNGKWTNPGGHLEKGEDPLKGAIREVKEETGLDLNSNQINKLDTKTVTKPNGEKITVHAYRSDLVRKPPTTMVTDPDEEVQRWHWVKPSELNNRELHVPLHDNILLRKINTEEQTMKGGFWSKAGKFGQGGFFKGAEMIEGGKASGKPESKYPQDQIQKGIKVEKEHTGSKELAKEIAKDHLEENDKYYTHLKKMEDKMEKSAFWAGFEKQAEQGRPLKESEKHYVRRAFLGQPISSAIEARKGKKLRAFGEGALHSLKETGKGLGVGAGLGGLAGAGLGALKGRAGTGAAIGALLGGYGGGAVGSFKGHFGRKASELHGKYAAEQDPSWWQKQKGMYRALRQSDKGLGKFVASSELVGDRVKKGLTHGLIGGAGGALGGAGIGALTGTPGFRGRHAAMGAALGGLLGLQGGAIHGQYGADKKYLGKRGITPKYLGLSADFSPEARKKYIDKYDKK